MSVVHFGDIFISFNENLPVKDSFPLIIVFVEAIKTPRNNWNFEFGKFHFLKQFLGDAQF